ASAIRSCSGVSALRPRNAGGTTPPVPANASSITVTTGATTGATTTGVTGSNAATQGAVLRIPILLVSRVTAPLRASALPHEMVAPVFSVMLVSARISPTKVVVVPSVAELPTRQK